MYIKYILYMQLSDYQSLSILWKDKIGVTYIMLGVPVICITCKEKPVIGGHFLGSIFWTRPSLVAFDGIL